MEQIGFGIISACLLGAALGVVTGKNLVHSVLWLAVTLVTTAALYVFLNATFLAGIQVILYTGGVITLMLFGVMLTRRDERVMVENEHNGRRLWIAALAALGLFALLAAATFKTPGLPRTQAEPTTTDAIGRAFLTEHLLAFEVLSLLLLAAMVGAIVLARRHDAGADARGGL